MSVRAQTHVLPGRPYSRKSGARVGLVQGGVPFANVATLIHFNAHPYVDTSLLNKTVTAPAATLDTVTPLVGAGSLKTDASGTRNGALISNSGYDLIPANSFCIEAVVNIASWNAGQNAQILGCWKDGSNYTHLSVFSNGALVFFHNVAGVIQGVDTAAATIVAGVTYHVAFVCNAGVPFLYVNGVNVTQNFGPFTTPLLMANGQGIREFTSGFAYDGLLAPFWYSVMRVDELRITKDNPRYTANFTPVYPFPDA